MADLEIQKHDEVNMTIECERSLAKELSDYFTFTVPNHKYMPSYRNKVWDGTIKLYNMYTQKLYMGLYDYVLKFASDRNYTVKTFEKEEESHSRESVLSYMKDFLKPCVGGERVTPHEHQVDAVHSAINKGRMLLLSPTGSGKSFIIYSLIRYFLDKMPPDKKILVIVPTVSLVDQMYSDFVDYSAENKWNCSKYCHCIHGGRDKETNKRVVISTWQSIYKMDKEYFDDFEGVFGDECHLYKAKSLTTIMSKLTNAKYRIGTTGTLDDIQVHKLVIEGLFGPVVNFTTTKALIDKKLLSNLDIKCLVLSYSDEEKKEIARCKYQEEMEWLVSNKERNDFISKLAQSVKGNTLVLFQYVEKHGKVLYDMLKKDREDVFFVYGGTESDDRERIRKIMEEKENAIIVPSYGTFSTGISIKRLHNIIFASPSKSRIRVMQSIGRQLRLSKYKEKAILFDIADDLSWKSWKNHTLKHHQARVKMYANENFNYKIVHIKDKGV